MKRSLLAAGVGLCIFTVTMVASNHTVKAEEYNGNYITQDTTPKKKKDTTRKKPDTMNLINMSSQSSASQK